MLSVTIMETGVNINGYSWKADDICEYIPSHADRWRLEVVDEQDYMYGEILRFFVVGDKHAYCVRTVGCIYNQIQDPGYRSD